MTRCSECDASQYEGALFCSECGGLLFETDGSETAVFPFADLAHHSPPPPLLEETLQPVFRERRMTFFIPGSRQRIELLVSGEIQVGRADHSSGVAPELDLTTYEGAEKGVSRLHAVIKSFEQSVVLVDLGSTNGTFLNAYRLPEKQPYTIQSGDEIRFGDLLIHLFFE